MLSLLIIVIVVALIFDFVNGFHDAANSIATVVSTKVLSPLQAVIWAATFNVLAFWVFDMNVGNTVAKTVDVSAIDLWVILAGLIAALFWSLLTWWLGIPSSSSHTLIGGFAGAAVAHAGFAVIAQKEILLIVLFIFLAPLIGALISFLITLVTISRVFWRKMALIILISGLTIFMMEYMITAFNMSRMIALLFYIMVGCFLLGYGILYLVTRKNPSAHKETILYRRMQLVSSAAFSIGHGGADSQKVMGIICAALLVYGQHAYQNNTAVDTDLKISEVLLIEGKNSEGKKESTYLLQANGDNYMVQKDGERFVDIKTNRVLFDGSKMSQELASNANYGKFVDSQNNLKPELKLKTKIQSATMPTWVAFTCYLMIGLGTLFGGWKIVKTMGSKITKVSALEGVCAETAGAITLFTVSQMGVPVSTTHTITGSIIGVGATKRLSAVRWGVTRNLLWAWVLTIPVSAILAAGIYYLFLFIR
ncbi:MAG: inorganic phosphate transporter [Bacteroidetes bacterium]|nr:inorganic phosphate transporter [Bacteroidota bacterium]